MILGSKYFPFVTTDLIFLDDQNKGSNPSISCSHVPAHTQGATWGDRVGLGGGSVWVEETTLKGHHILLKILIRVATFESVQNSLTFSWHFPNKIMFFSDNLFYFSRLNTYSIVIKGNLTTYTGFLTGSSLTVIISRPWLYIYICQISR